MSGLPEEITPVLATYRSLLEEIDTWFNRCQASFPELISCRKACSGCCRGLFDITLMDAALLRQGFEQLPATHQRQVSARCESRAAELLQRWPQLSTTWILNQLPEQEWQKMPEDDPTPCPFLANASECLVYPYRPMICRLHGLPNIDTSGEDFSGAICSLNFRGVDPHSFEDLRWHFHEVFSSEIALFEEFSRRLCGRPLRELDTFIPCVPFIDFKRKDWQELLADYGCR